MTPPDKRLVAALALSVLAHVAFAIFAPAVLPEPEDKSTVITTRLQYMPPPPVAALKTPAPAKSKPVVKKTAPQVPPPAGTAIAALPSAPVIDAPLEPPPPPPPEPEKIVEVAQPVAPDPPKTLEPEPERVPTNTAFASGADMITPEKTKSKGEQQLEALPRLIDLNYKAGYAQGDAYPMNIGNFKLRFEHAEGKYTLRTTGQASGFFKFVYPGVLKMQSTGKLTERGLEPDAFEMFRERQGRETKPRKIVFDREAKLILLNDKPPVPIEGQVFDLLTFIVQFYFAAPDSDEVTLQVVSPTRIDAYTLKRSGKETLDTPQGKIETEIWRGSRKSAEGSAEFWLAPSWHYIPFRVRMTDEKERKASFDLESVAVEQSLAQTPK